MLKFSTLCRIVRLNLLFKCAEKTYIVNIDRVRRSAKILKKSYCLDVGKGQNDKEGCLMKTEEQLQALKAENEQLKKDREELLKIIGKMRVTLNRLIDQYIAVREKR